MLTLCHNYFRVTSSNKNSKDVPQRFNKRKFAFGIFILLLVVVLWVVSSEMTKYLYVEKHIERPFLVTYVRSSLLFIYLLVLCFTPPTRDPCQPADYTQLLEQTGETDDESYFNESTNSLVQTQGDSTFVPVRAGETTDSDDAAPRAVRFNKVAEVRVMSAAMASEALLARLSWAASVRATEHAQRRAAAAATRRHLRLALLFCVPVVLGISESHQTNWIAVLAALGSALCYAVHLLLFRQALRNGDDINSSLLVGLVGCACGCLTWVIGGLLAATGVERAELPPPRQWTWLLLDAALGPLLIDSLWLWGKSLTSPQAATGILGLAVPLSVCVEAWRGGGAWQALAAALAGAGWAAAAAPLPQHCFTCLTERLRAAEGFTVIRNIPDLDEQSEALMSSDEPT
ncbi:solute carrier family 35 member F5 isoform X3 [Helicoverpa zea]|uniref:solute carrier family 35 member F5 isoform X3 n=1 Tax=Helicoverpa zea TaxID=7113 RepID=UPI001F58EBE9|nr:solute carrier family 35 member F5 isoform X3 [Helicoverpa zea]